VITAMKISNCLQKNEQSQSEGILSGQLFESILHSAINDYLWYSKGQEEYDDAHDWLFTDDSGGAEISFIELCLAMDMCTDRLRYMFVELKDKGKRRLLRFEIQQLFKLCELNNDSEEIEYV